MRLDALTGRHRTSDPRVAPGGKAISVSGRVVWVANGRTRELIELGAAAPHRLLARIRLTGIPVAVAADPRGGVWTAVRGPGNGSPATVLRYDASGHVLAQASFPAGVLAIALAPASLWVAEYGTARLMRVDRRTGRERFGPALPAVAGSLAYGGGCLWASMPYEDAVARVCPHGGSTAFRAVGSRPERLVYAHGRVYVASRFDHTLRVLDPKRMQPAQPPLRMPLNPFAVTAGRRHVWVTSLGADAIARVDVG
jgi:hypothetical protein